MRKCYLLLLFALAACKERPVPREGPPKSPPPPSEGNRKITSFAQSKRIALKLYASRPFSFYCGCRFNPDKEMDLKSCNYQREKDVARAHRLEWEHIVPAHAFGQSFPAWRNGDLKCVKRNGKPYKGRRCASKVSKEFRYIEADLYNLYPAIGEINAIRSNKSMGVIAGEKREFGPCDIEIDKKLIEPAPKIRGDIARTYLYMNHVYPGRGILSKKRMSLYRVWSKEDPVDSWECERARRIAKIQGNINPFVSKPCQEAKL